MCSVTFAYLTELLSMTDFNERLRNLPDELHYRNIAPTQ
jgi:hypothetical protein